MTTRIRGIRPGDAIAAAIEYTDLRKEITYRDVEAMCADAAREGFRTIVVPSALVPRAARCLSSADTTVATVVSHPFGTQSALVKATEASVAVEQGAGELDIVPHFGTILAEDWRSVRAEFTEIRTASGSVPLKLVLETGRLRSSQIREACAIAVDCGFSYVSNSVGFRLVSTDPQAEGAANAEIIHMLHDLCRGRLEVKAVGGITSLEIIQDLVHAGAARVALCAAPESFRSGGGGMTSKEST